MTLNLVIYRTAFLLVFMQQNYKWSTRERRGIGVLFTIFANKIYHFSHLPSSSSRWYLIEKISKNAKWKIPSNMLRQHVGTIWTACWPLTQHVGLLKMLANIFKHFSKMLANISPTFSCWYGLNRWPTVFQTSFRTFIAFEFEMIRINVGRWYWYLCSSCANILVHFTHNMLAQHVGMVNPSL